MTNNVYAVAELNLPSSEPKKFVWDLNLAEAGEIPRSTRSKPPDYHIYLASNKEATPLLTSTPKAVDLTNVPLPHSSGSWENDDKNSGGKPGVIQKQPSSFSGTSPIPYNPLDQVDVDADKYAIGNLPPLSLNAQSDVADEQPAVVFDNIGGDNLQALQQGVVVQAPLILNQVVIDPVGVPVQLHLPNPVGPLPPVVALDDANIDDSSDDELNDTSMTENVIAPPSFSGKSSQDPADWIRHFVLYCTFKGYTAARQKALFKVLLTDGAADWLEGQNFTDETDFDALKQAFESRYQSPSVLRYKSAKEVFTKRQAVSQNVDDYITEMVKAGKIIQMSDQMLQFAVLNGLRPELATYVTQRQPETMSELLQAARIAELTLPVSKDTELHEKIDRLMSHWDKATTAQVTSERRSPSPAGAAGFQPPKRVTFEDWRRQPNFRPRSAVASRGNFRMNTPNCQPRGGYGGYSRDVTQQQSQQPRPGVYQRYQTPRGFAGNTPMQRFPTGNRETQRCVKCGLQPHSHPNYCPAINETCYACGKRGHFSRVCRSAFAEPQNGNF